MEPSRRLTGSTHVPPPDAFHFVIRSDGSLHPEVNFREGIHVVIHLRTAIDPGSILLAPTGSAIVALVGKHLSRSPPPGSPRRFSSVTERLRRTQVAQRTFGETMSAMSAVEAVLGTVNNPETRNWVVNPCGRAEKVADAAQVIVQCLLQLQNESMPAQTRCLHCLLPPQLARNVPEDTQTMEMHSNHYCTTGYTTLDAVSILPPIRDFNRPMLCRRHQYEFQYMIYQVVCPTWPVPDLAEDVLRFGPIPRYRSRGGN